MNEIPGEVFVRFVSGLVSLGERAGAKEPDDNGYRGGKVSKIKGIREQWHNYSLRHNNEMCSE